MKKKIFIGVLLFLMLFTVVSPAMAAPISACSQVMPNADIDMKIPNTISLIIKIIRVAAPVLLVIFGSIDLMKGIIAQKEDEIKKGQQIFIKRLIAGALVFFVFVIVQFLISLVADDKGSIMDCANCFINGGDDCQSSTSDD